MGSTLGAQDGSPDGLTLGATVTGAAEGLPLSLLDGFVVGNNEGLDDTSTVGGIEGSAVGFVDVILEGIQLGAIVVGVSLGPREG